MTGDARYMDVFERSLYNGVLSGVSLSGDRFFYPNPLEYDGRAKNNHGHAGRAPWFGCACCPPNLLRLIASLGEYAYAVRDDALFVNLYATGTARARVARLPVQVAQTTDYPWTGGVTLRVDPASAATFTLCLRLPGWAQGRPLPGDLYAYASAEPAAWTVTVNGQRATPVLRDGFLRITREWKPADTVQLDLPMPVRRVTAHAAVTNLAGMVALERGPIVYCFEGIDHPGDMRTAILPDSANITATPRPDLLGGVTTLEITGAQNPAHLTAIPYAVWNNRGLHPMCVWLARGATNSAATTR
jgi:hypothetical protein